MSGCGVYCEDNFYPNCFCYQSFISHLDVKAGIRVKLQFRDCFCIFRKICLRRNSPEKNGLTSAVDSVAIDAFGCFPDLQLESLDVVLCCFCKLY